MGKKLERQAGRNRRLRLRLFDAGNTRCPICLSNFKKTDVKLGRVTLEHAPPKSLEGSAICLTCRQCNNSASRIDHQALLAQQAIEEWSAGQGTRVEIDFLGVKKLLRYYPSDPESPFPIRVAQLRKGTMKLGALPAEQLDASKGIRFRIPRAPHDETVGLIKTAYLLVFSLMGEGGYRFAESEALRPVREQIMNPGKNILKGRFVVRGTIPGLAELKKQLVFLCHAARPPAWLIPLWNGKVVLLPCGGSEPIDEFVASKDEITLQNNQLAGWAACRFNESLRIAGSVSEESGIADGTLVGSTGLVPTNKGEWEWMVVDHHLGHFVALPFRNASESQSADTLNAVEMLGSNTVQGRGLDKSALTSLNLGDWSKDLTIFGKIEKTPAPLKVSVGTEDKNTT